MQDKFKMDGNTFNFINSPFLFNVAVEEEEVQKLYLGKKLYDVSTYYFLNGGQTENLIYKPICDISMANGESTFDYVCMDMNDTCNIKHFVKIIRIKKNHLELYGKKIR